MRRGRYYLGRIVKINFDQSRLLSAIRESAIVGVGKFTWTITNVIEEEVNGSPFIMGRLSKYAQEGHVTVVDEEQRLERTAIAPKLLEASSPFLYMPEFSGIAYMHVWNAISDDLFCKRFKTVIEAKYDNFFVDCSVEPISDYKSFAAKLSKLSRITQISATVHPPNPLFGRCWKSLDGYIKKRNAETVMVKENNEGGDGIRTTIIQIVNAIIQNPDYVPDIEPDITDAALLMAADGYGRGSIAGIEDSSEIIIRTSDTQKCFLFDKDPDPDALAQKVLAQLSSVSHERNMKHGEVH